MFEEKPWMIRFSPFNVGMFLGAVSCLSLFHLQSEGLRIVVGFLAGTCFSPAFTSGSFGSQKYYAISFCLTAFALLSLSDLKYSVVAGLLALALSTGIEAQGIGAVEVAKRQRESN